MTPLIDFDNPLLACYHAQARSSGELPTLQLWQHVLCELVLPKRRWRVNTNVPVVQGSFRHVDMAVRLWDNNASTTVLLWMSGGTHGPEAAAAAPSVDVGELEARAIATGAEYLQKTQRSAVWIMTAFGSYARVWVYATGSSDTVGEGQLVPVFPPAVEVSAAAAYLELRGNEFEFGFWFDFIQKNHLPTAEWAGDLSRGNVSGVLVDARNAVHAVVVRARGRQHPFECLLPDGKRKLIPPGWRMGYVVSQGQIRQCDYRYCGDGDRLELYWAWNLFPQDR